MSNISILVIYHSSYQLSTSLDHLLLFRLLGQDLVTRSGVNNLYSYKGLFNYYMSIFCLKEAWYQNQLPVSHSQLVSVSSAQFISLDASQQYWCITEFQSLNEFKSDIDSVEQMQIGLKNQTKMMQIGPKIAKRVHILAGDHQKLS